MPEKGYQFKSKRQKLALFIKQGYKYVLFVFTILLLLYLIFFIWWPKPINNLFLKIDPTGNFEISFSASLLENLFFFFTLGILGSLIPIMILKSPDEENYDTRVRALMNNPDLYNNEKLVDFFKHNLKKSISFVRDLTITYIIKEYNNKHNAYKIFTEYDFTLVNMCNDVEYENAPELASIKIVPDTDVDGEYGHISYLGTYSPKDKTRITTIIDEDQVLDHHIFKTKDPFTRRLDIQIPPKGELAWRLRYTLWSKIGALTDTDELHYYQAIRYVNKVTVQVANHCDRLNDIKFTAKKLKFEGNLRTLLAENVELEYNTLKPITSEPFELYPEDRIELYFFKPNEKQVNKQQNEN